jgi:hypothetical protein
MLNYYKRKPVRLSIQRSLDVSLLSNHHLGYNPAIVLDFLEHRDMKVVFKARK